MENPNPLVRVVLRFPFMHLFYKGDANTFLLRSCCETPQKIQRILILKITKITGPSDYMKNVRQQMLDGIVPEFCKSCLNIEKS